MQAEKNNNNDNNTNDKTPTYQQNLNTNDISESDSIPMSKLFSPKHVILFYFFQLEKSKQFISLII